GRLRAEGEGALLDLDGERGRGVLGRLVLLLLVALLLLGLRGLLVLVVVALLLGRLRRARVAAGLRGVVLLLGLPPPRLRLRLLGRGGDAREPVLPLPARLVGPLRGALDGQLELDRVGRRLGVALDLDADPRRLVRAREPGETERERDRGARRLR